MTKLFWALTFRCQSIEELLRVLSVSISQHHQAGSCFSGGRCSIRKISPVRGERTVEFMQVGRLLGDKR